MENRAAELVFIPAPGLGHIMSTIEIANFFVNRDQRLSVTVLVIKPPSSSSGSTVTTYIQSLAKNTMDHISFLELPQDKIPPTSDSKGPLTAYNIEFIKSHCRHVRNIMADMISKPGSRRVAAFVIDMFCTSMINVVNEFNVPTYAFFTCNAAFLGFKFYIQTLCDDKNQDVIQLSHSDTEIRVPTFVKPIPTKVLPAIVRTRESLVCHLHGDYERESLDDDVIRWLDDQPPASVVFLCFGSMGSFEEVQVKEIVHALEQSGHHFLWSLRRPPSDSTSRVTRDYEDPRVVLSEGFLERTTGIGKVIVWAPQVAVLAHRAVGGFVSHCGWNSLLESIWFGVPVVVWPMYAEQPINAFEMVVELGLAVEIKLDYRKDLFNPMAETVIVTTEEIEIGIRRLMEDDSIRTKVKMMSSQSRSTVKFNIKIVFLKVWTEYIQGQRVRCILKICLWVQKPVSLLKY
ncbi:hypothetical protein L1987_56542 [Smallanthus sonchifolius]|uniref:Uncharacterized protein n=1 Tax=Smallanthus sonchifolius TaxID=185202 RepID=A0ACB9ECZ7_9ASTR|nr:hypothetical protein L1987_56542 [Smallanthus sonchifolius]